MSVDQFRPHHCALAVLALAAVLALSLLEPVSAHAALKGAAGGGTASGGFTSVISYADKLATYLIALAIPGAVIGAIAVGFMFMSGKPDAMSFASRLAIGFILVVAAKGIAS